MEELTKDQAERMFAIPAYQLTLKTLLEIAPLSVLQDALLSERIIPMGEYRTALMALPGFGVPDLAQRQSVVLNQQLLEAVKDLRDEIIAMRLAWIGQGS